MRNRGIGEMLSSLRGAGEMDASLPFMLRLRRTPLLMGLVRLIGARDPPLVRPVLVVLPGLVGGGILASAGCRPAPVAGVLSGRPALGVVPLMPEVPGVWGGVGGFGAAGRSCTRPGVPRKLLPGVPPWSGSGRLMGRIVAPIRRTGPGLGH